MYSNASTIKKKTPTRNQKNNRIGGVMVAVPASSVVGRGFESSPGQIKPKTIKLVFVASPLSTQH